MSELIPNTRFADRLSPWFDAAAGFAVSTLALIGLVKAQVLQDAVPVDLTLLSAALCLALSVVAVLARRKLPIDVLWVGLLMVVLAIPGLLWASDVDNTYADTKMQELLTMVPACLLAPMVLLVTARARTWFLAVVVVTAMIPAWFVLTAKIDPLYGRATVGDLNPIGLGRVLAAAAIVLAVYAMRSQRLGYRIASTVAAVVLLYGVWRTGSRGPLLATFLALAVVALIGLASRASRRVLLTCVAAAAVVALVGMLLLYSGLLVHRDTIESDSERLDLYRRSLVLLASHPGGIGWGNLIDHLQPGEVIANQGWVQYPHNILLEVGVEGGWIALAALVVLSAVSVRRLAARRETFEGAALLALWIFAAGVAMTSSDFTSNRLTLVMIGVGLVRPIAGRSLARPGERHAPPPREGR